MNRLTRNYSPKQQQMKKASRFIRNTGVVIETLSTGYLPIRHNSLPVPFKSFVVETPAGKRYVVQVRGRQAWELKLNVGNTVNYDGRFLFATYATQGDSGRGGYFLASFVERISDKCDEYVASLVEAKRSLEVEQARQQMEEGQ